MVEKDETSKPRRSRAAHEPAAQPGEASPRAAVTSPVRSRGTLEQAIEAERAQMLQAHGVLMCLYEVLLHADGEDAVSYAQAAHVAANLIERSAERLDLVRLRPLIESPNVLRDASPDALTGGYCVQGPQPRYMA